MWRRWANARLQTAPTWATFQQVGLSYGLHATARRCELRLLDSSDGQELQRLSLPTPSPRLWLQPRAEGLVVALNGGLWLVN